MSSFRGFSWWKAYVIYLVIITLFLVPVILLVHGSWFRAAAYAVIIITGLMLKDRVQRRIWP